MNVMLNATRPELPIAPDTYAKTISTGTAHQVPATPAATNAITDVAIDTAAKVTARSRRGTTGSTRPTLRAPTAIVAAVANSPTAAPTATMTPTRSPRRIAEGQPDDEGWWDRMARATSCQRVGVGGETAAGLVAITGPPGGLPAVLPSPRSRPWRSMQSRGRRVVRRLLAGPVAMAATFVDRLLHRRPANAGRCLPAAGRWLSLRRVPRPRVWLASCAA